MSDTESSNDLLTVDEVAEQLKVNPQTVRNWITAEKLPALRIGGRRVRVQRSALERFVGMQTSPDLGLPSQKRAVSPTQSSFDREAVATALDQIASGFGALAAALRGDRAVAKASGNAARRSRKTASK